VSMTSKLVLPGNWTKQVLLRTCKEVQQSKRAPVTAAANEVLTEASKHAA
jgi:hypothetical protein